MADIATLGIAVDTSDVQRAAVTMDEMARAARGAEKAADGMAKEVAKGSLAALQFDKAINSAVSTVVDLTKGFVSLALAVGNYQDIADTTFADPAGLASVRTAADVAGTSISQVARMIQQMNVRLDDTKEDSRAARALKRLHLNVQEFRALRADEQVRALAKALDEFSDTNEKIGVITSLTGRGGAENLRFLKELAQEREKDIGLTTAQIQKADELADSIERNRSKMRQYIEFLAVGTLPALEAVTKATRSWMEGLLGVDSASDKLTKQRAVQEFALRTAQVFAKLADSVDYVVRGYQALSVIQECNAFADRIFSEWKGLTNTDLSALWDQVKARQEQQMKELKDIWNRPTPSSALATEIARLRAEQAAESFPDMTPGAPGGKPKLDPDKKDKKEKEKHSRASGVDEESKAYLRLTESVQKYLRELEEELAHEEKLSRWQKMRAELIREQARAQDGSADALSQAQSQADAALIAKGDALDHEIKLREKRLKLTKELADAEHKAAEEGRKVIDNIMQRTRSVQDQIDAIAGVDEIDRQLARSRARLAEIRSMLLVGDGDRAADPAVQAAIAEAEAIETHLIPAIQQLTQARKAEDALKPKAGADAAVAKYIEEIGTGYDRAAQMATTSIHTIEGALTELMVNGKTDTKAFVNTLLAEFYRLAVIKPLLKNIFGDDNNRAGGGASWTGWLTRLFTGAVGGGGAGDSLGATGKETTFAGQGKSGTMSSGSSGKASVVQNITVNVDARSDQSQVAEIAMKTMREGQRAMLAELEGRGIV